MTRRSLSIAVLMLASACGQQPMENNVSATVNVATVALNAAERKSSECPPPELQLADGAWPFESTLLNETRANFAIAYRNACARGLLKQKPLVDPEAPDHGTLIMTNAPDANIASIYPSDVAGGRMILEYPFWLADGSQHVPSAEDLEEAIYCKVVGATPEEEEKTGRCLPD